jgi:uncharacterized protein (TIGR00730 family)
MNINKVCIFCASSRKSDSVYFDAAKRLGKELAKNKSTIIYGGGAVGLMGAIADSALSEGGKVIGILPKFMQELEWGHKNLTELHLVLDLHERKKKLIDGVDAVIALPGGCGTFEELFEAITLKRLAIYLNPIIILNTNHFYDPLIELLESSINQNFMDERHRHIWSVVHEPEEVIPAIINAPKWADEAIKFAAL